ncbi:MAG: M1 family metallopeptidase [Salinibacter sp.]
MIVLLRTLSAICLILLLGPSPAPAQDRPTPHPISPPPRFEDALEQGTRTASGRPGPAYWTNRASYDIEATLSPATNTVRGQETITYHNRSPDTLKTLVVHLRQNVNAKGAERRQALQVTGGMDLGDVSVQGQNLIERPNRSQVGYTIENTVMRIRPPEAVPPGGSVKLSFAWRYTLRSQGPTPRQGTNGTVYYMGYWYPQMAVYDDVQGWDTDPFLQFAEFYMGYADYTLELTVPDGWLIGSTGTLQNPTDVLTARTRSRLEQARTANKPVRVVSAEERGAGSATQADPSGSLTWRFRAENVRDVAWGTSDQYVWDAAQADAGKGRTTMIHALYRPNRDSWRRAAEFGKFSIEFLSERLTAYPYPHMTVVEGLVGGGMEYPMITIVGSDRSEKSLFGTTLHEIAHMWYPMLVGSEETDHIWMDEGLVTYFTRQGRRAFWDEGAPWAANSGYFRRAGTARETEPMRHGDLFPNVGSLVSASYDKASRMLYVLRGLYGADSLHAALRTYAERWTYKHPYPYDFFNTVEDVLGDDLDWLWRSMLYETWTLDQSIAGVEESDGGVTIRIRDEGHSMMPTPVRVTYADGSTHTERVPVDVWLKGRRTASLSVPAGTVERVEIDPGGFLPDVNRSNNTWTADASR